MVVWCLVSCPLLHILEISLLSVVVMVKIFFHFFRELFCPVYYVLCFPEASQVQPVTFIYELLLPGSMLPVCYLLSGILCICVQIYFPLILLWGSVCIVLCWGPWYIWTWVLCMVLDIDLLAFFYRLKAVIPAIFEGYVFSFAFCIFSFLFLNLVLIGVWVNIKIFDSIPLFNLSVFMPLWSCFH